MTYLVAEIGQNHSGTVTNAKDLARIVANPRRTDLYGEDVGGVDAVKLTRRSLSHELTRAASLTEYTGANSFGPTYGEHRAALELSDEEHGEVYRYAKSLGLEFVETICAVEAMSVLDHAPADYIKVASRDLTNHRLLDALASTHVPMILSTGMADRNDLDAALEVVTKHHENLTILHCTSTYPCPPEHANLETIPWMKERYPYRIGYSNHCQGIAVPVAAVAMGAETLEFHVTLDRMMRGTDHEASLERDGVYRLVRDVRAVEQARGKAGMFVEPVVRPARRKLERSVASAVEIPEGRTITERDIEPLSPGDGIPWPERGSLVGRTTIHAVPAKTKLTATMAVA